MSLTSFLSHVARDERHQARIRSGLRAPLPPRDPRIVQWGGVIRYAATVKPVGVSIPEGCIVIAVRRDAHGRCHGLMVEAFEGDRAGFATFPRLAHMLGATELQIVGSPATMLDRLHAVQNLEGHARFDRAALLSRPLAVAGQFDRSAIMLTACAAAKARQSVTGEAWGACLSAALKGAWILARAARLATAH